MNARLITCSTCGAETSRPCRLCDDCIRARTVAERASQGLPPTITDPAAIHLAAFHIRRAHQGAAA